jgi:UDP-N-acetylglucosamine 2-epimerase (non-hydrolysing)
MKSKVNILAVVGTRPEAIKMAPVILALREQEWASVTVLATAQHRQMLDQVFDTFGITADIDLDIMMPNQSLTRLTSRILAAMEDVFAAEVYDVVLVQGDTTTVMAVAMAAFYHKVPVGHIEAGLRTGDLANPFPEEMNRIVAGNLSRWHFAPTMSSRQNLLREGFSGDSIHVTGNTVIDALMEIASRDPQLGLALPQDKRLILVTAHRRENFGAPLREICQALLDLLEQHDDLHVLYPVHPNPNVKQVVDEMLGGHPSITLCAPLDYMPFIAALKLAYLVLSDSGGVQEEAPALGKPVLVLRHETERPEAVAAGVVALVGPNRAGIVRAANELLASESAYKSMARGVSPYGDGHAAERIVGIIKHAFIGE